MRLTYQMIYEQPVVYEFENIKVPTLLIIGQDDRTIVGKKRVPKEIINEYGQYPQLGRAARDKIKNAQTRRNRRCRTYSAYSNAGQIRAGDCRFSSTEQTINLIFDLLIKIRARTRTSFFMETENQPTKFPPVVYVVIAVLVVEFGRIFDKNDERFGLRSEFGTLFFCRDYDCAAHEIQSLKSR